MTPIDHNTLNQALTRLTTVAIPDGLEQRLLTRLATHTAPQSRGAHPLFAHLRHQLASLRPRRPLLAASAALAALVVVAAGLRHLAPHPPTRTVDVTLRSFAPPPVPPVPSPEARRAPLLATPAWPAHSHAPALAPTATPSNPQSAVPDADRALAETRAPSQLAPPLPLTDDERALQHLAQHSTPDALNALNADHRNAQEAEEKAAFVAFFTPPTPPHNEHSGESE